MHPVLWCSVGLLSFIVSAAAGTIGGRQGRHLLASAPNLPLQNIKLPPAFTISLYANASFPARFLALGQASQDATIVYVSSTKGVVTALVQRPGGAVEACTLLSGLDLPDGVTYDPTTHSLYVAELTGIKRYDGADASALAGCSTPPAGVTVVGQSVLPNQAGHVNRFLGLGPDGRLYVTVAAPFNVDVCHDPFCTIHRLHRNGSGAEIFARGIRNAAAWTWHPATGALLFSGMERDYLGDDLPDDLLGIADRPGINFQWPYCHWTGNGPPELRLPGPGRAIGDPNVTLPELVADGEPHPNGTVAAERCSAIAPPPVQALGPHVAPLGVLSWQGNGSGWPAQYDGSLFIAQHGSWNRRVPVGYRIATLKLGLDHRTAVSYTVFAEGWLQTGGKYWGRPVGLLQLPDGSLLAADDYAEVVYRIAYHPDACLCRAGVPYHTSPHVHHDAEAVYGIMYAHVALPTTCKLCPSLQMRCRNVGLYYCMAGFCGEVSLPMATCHGVKWSKQVSRHFTQ